MGGGIGAVRGHLRRDPGRGGGVGPSSVYLSTCLGGFGGGILFVVTFGGLVGQWRGGPSSVYLSTLSLGGAARIE